MAQIGSGADATLLTVDPLSFAARASLYDNLGNKAIYNEADQPNEGATAGIMVMGMNDRQAVPIRVDRFGSQGLSLHTPLFTESFEGTTIHPIRWTITTATMGATQSSVNGLLLNSTAITTINTGYMAKTNRAFAKAQRQPIQAKIRAKPLCYNNSVFEIGFGDASTFNGANTTGAYWQMTPTGVIQPVLTFNSSDITGSDVRGLLDFTKFYTFDVFLDDDEAVFFVQDTSTGLILSRQAIKLPMSAMRLWSSTQLTGLIRCYNTGTAPATASQPIVSDFYIAGLDANLNLPASEMLSLMHRSASCHPQTGVQSAAWTNSAEPASATLSNTAAGYTTLGGKFQFAAVAGAVTDFALFGYQVPAPATLAITGIDIETWNTGAAVATTPTLLTWAVASNLTAVSLATASHERVGLGSQTLAVGAAIGVQADRRISKQFKTPIVCGPGRFVDIILRMPVGTATASQVIAGMVNIEGYWL